MLRILIILSLSCRLDLASARPAEESTRFNLSIIENDTKNVWSSPLEQEKVRHLHLYMRLDCAGIHEDAILRKYKCVKEATSLKPLHHFIDIEELLGRVADAIRIGRGKLVNSIILFRNVIADQEEQLSNTEASNNLASIVTKSDKPNPSRRSLTSVQTTTPIVLFQPEYRETVRLENDTSQAILERRKPDNILQAFGSFLNSTPIVDRIKEEEKYGNTGDRFIGFGRGIVNAFENLSNFLNTVVDLPINAAKQTSRGITETLNQLGARLIGFQ